MGAPTFYSSKDAGAVWPSPIAASNSHNAYAKRHYAIYHALKMCLVDGYEGKPAAGWTMLFDEIAAGTGRRYALTNASKSGVLLVDREYYLHSQINVCDALPDIDSPINRWSAGYSPENGQSASAHYIKMVADTRWGTSESSFYIVANENACFVAMYPRASYQSSYQNVGSGHYMPKFYFGAINGPAALGTVAAPELGNFVFMGGAKSTYSSNIGSNQTHFFGRYNYSSTPLSSTRNRDGSIRTAPPKNVYFWPLQFSAQVTDPDENVKVAALVQVYLGEERSGHNGYLTYKPPFFVNIYSDYYKAVNQIAANFNGVGLYEPFEFEGKRYVGFSSPYNNLTPIVSLDLEDWS